MFSRSRVRLAAAGAAVLVLAACGIGTTGPATNVGDTTATLTGTADSTAPGNITYWFEYGTTTGYGTSTDHRTRDITAPVPVSATVDGLDPHAIYHYRLCVHDNGDDRGSCGKDLTFSTTGNIALRVNNAGDVSDANPGDGVCQDQGAAAGRCSLRAAVQEANARTGNDTVIVSSGLGVIALTHGELLVSSVLTLRGNGATLDAGGASRVLDVVSGRLALERATVTHGRAATGGGLFVASGATATVVDSMVTANESTGLYQCSDYSSGVSPPITVDCRGVGGGAGIFSDGTLQVSRSTISANHAIGGGCSTEPVGTGSVATVTTCTWSQGAGIHSAGGAVTDTTVTGNRSDRGWGTGITAVRGAVSVTHATVADNIGGAQVDVCCGTEGHGLPADGSIAARGSIVAGLQPVCQQAIGITSQDFNLASDPSCHLTQPGDRQGIGPVLNPLADNGGPTRTRLPSRTLPPSTPFRSAPPRCATTPPRRTRGECIGRTGRRATSVPSKATAGRTRRRWSCSSTTAATTRTPCRVTVSARTQAARPAAARCALPSPRPTLDPDPTRS